MPKYHENQKHLFDNLKGWIIWPDEEKSQERNLDALSHATRSELIEKTPYLEYTEGVWHFKKGQN